MKHEKKAHRMGMQAGVLMAAGALLLGKALSLGIPVRCDAKAAYQADGTIFDAKWYSKAYPDVVQNLETDDPGMMWWHYQTYGKKEGRLPYDPADPLTDVTPYTEPGTVKVTREVLNKDSRVLSSVKKESGYTIRNTGKTLSADTASAIESALSAYTQKGYDASFCVLDVESGYVLSCNTALTVYSASCIKGPYIISCLDSGIEPDGDMYLAGHDSDNEAYRRIRKAYGSQVFMNWLKKGGVDASLGQYYYAHLTSLDLAKMWLLMYPYLTGSEKNTAFAQKTLTGSLNSVLAEGPGKSLVVYSKAGWIANSKKHDYNVYNVGGIVMDDAPCIITITSNVPASTGQAQKLLSALMSAHREMIK